jgi:nucleoside-diphosphate-sugar epimerase
MKRSGGRKPAGFQAYSYVDARDLAVAFRLAVERPLSGDTIIFVVAEDSTIAERLSEFYARLNPSIADKARAITGRQSAYSNTRAKELLGWKPVYSWRNK